MKMQLLKCACIALLCTVMPSSVIYGQDDGGTGELTVSDVLVGIDQESSELENNAEAKDFVPWWSGHVNKPLIPTNQSISVDMNRLLVLALQHSSQLAFASEIPLIQEAIVQEVDAAFDWTTYADTLWRDTSEPVGNDLTVGGGSNRFNDHNITQSLGIRRRTQQGTEIDLSQLIGHQNNNSNFFNPNNQGTAVISLGFTQPLMRGRGVAYNTSLNVLARLDVETAQAEFSQELQAHLLSIARAYWDLYLERGALTQRVQLYLKTKVIAEMLEARLKIDAQQSQLVSAKAALAARKADLINARAAVKNAETRLRVLINAPDLGTSDFDEIVPVDVPMTNFLGTDLANETQLAVQNRPEIMAAMKEIQQAALRRDVSQSDLLPQLNLITRLFANGLRGGSEIGQAWTAQFSEGAPSYTIGLQFELPIGNRAAMAQLNRRRLEQRQLEEKYRNTLQTIGAEVEIAVRDVVTAFNSIAAKHRALSAAELEVASIEMRWQKMIDEGGSASLNLESLLRAQERVTDNEFQYLNAIVTYNLALISLRKSNGTLLQTEQIDLGRVCEDGLPRVQLNKSEMMNAMPTETPEQNEVGIIYAYPGQQYGSKVGGSTATIEPSPVSNDAITNSKPSSSMLPVSFGKSILQPGTTSSPSSSNSAPSVLPRSIFTPKSLIQPSSVIEDSSPMRLPSATINPMGQAVPSPPPLSSDGPRLRLTRPLPRFIRR